METQDHILTAQEKLHIMSHVTSDMMLIMQAYLTDRLEKATWETAQEECRRFYQLLKQETATEHTMIKEYETLNDIYISCERAARAEYEKLTGEKLPDSGRTGTTQRLN